MDKFHIAFRKNSRQHGKTPYYQRMSLSKEEIKNWLKEVGQNRFWLAEQCLVDKKTVDDWFTSRGKVPSKALLKIQSLMSESKAPESPQTANNEEITLNVIFRGEQKVIVEQFMETYPDISLPEYCRAKTLELCIGMDSAIAEKSIPSEAVGDTRDTGTA